MTVAAWFVLFNAAYLVAGCGALWILGIRTGNLRLVDFLLLAYASGVAATGVVVALLAVVNGVPGRLGFFVICAALFVAGRLRNRDPAFGRVAAWTLYDTAACIGATAAIAVAVSRFYRWPLGAWDGWAVWSIKTHSLYIWGGVSAPALHASAYNQGSHLDYPLLLPGLEAVWLHVVGRYDGQLLHLQLVCFLGAFACGLIVLLRQAAARPPVRLLIVIAAVSSPEIVDQLVTNYADIPLAFFAALGLVSLVLWTIDGAPWLPVASLFLAAATLTKSEGAIFVGAAFVAAFLSRRAQRRYTALGAAAIATAVPLLIWRAYTTSQHLTDPAYDPSLLHHPVALAHRVSRIGVAASGLAAQAIRWDFLLLIPIGGAVVAVAGKQRELVSFALRWTTISFLGLLVVYWISVLPIHQHVQTSADRLTASLVVGLLALAGVFSRDLPASAIASADERVPPEFGPVEARIHAS